MIRARKAWRAGGALVLVAVLAGCGSAGATNDPTWKPKPSFQGENVVPGNPQPIQPQQPSPPPGGSRSPAGPSPSAPPSQVKDPAVVATKLAAPIGIAILPDGTALVGERTTGRIVSVQPVPGQPVKTIRTLTGLSTTGDGGLLDLALSPYYAQDNLIFAYVTTPTDNRVVAFTLTGPVTKVLTGIPRGPSDNTGRIAVAPDGSLLVGTGDAGRPELAADPNSLAGKVLRITDVGTAAPGNPTPGSRIFTSGHRVVDGLCVSPQDDAVFEVETRDRVASDPVNLIEPGSSYGWPGAGPRYRQPEILLPQTSRAPGGCAVLDGRLFITTRDGQALLAARTASGIGDFTPSLRGKYGRLRTVVAAPDGALWLTTSNRDGAGNPVAADERVLRIVPNDDAASAA